MIGGKIVKRVKEEVNDARVMVEWWNEDVMLGRYEDVEVRSCSKDSGSACIEAYDTVKCFTVRRIVTLADFSRIEGVLSVAYCGEGNYRVSVAETEDCDGDGWKKSYAPNLETACW